MNKKVISLISVLVIVLLFGAVSSFADSIYDDDVSDGDQNRYALSGSLLSYGRYGKVVTHFEIAHVFDGTTSTRNQIKNASKDFVAYADVYFVGGGQNHFGSREFHLTGNPVSAQATSETYLYNIRSMVGEHQFSYNGANWRGYTYYPN